MLKDVLQQNILQLLIYGSCAPEKKQGPAIWIKCMVANVIVKANWDNDVIPIIYLPGRELVFMSLCMSNY